MRGWDALHDVASLKVMKTIHRTAWALLLMAPLARADLVYLRNGRTVEGEVVEHTTARVALKLPGGKVVFPTSQVERVEKRQTYRQEFGERVRQTDMTDPLALDELSLWASSRGLGEEAQALTGMAQGLRLEARIEELRESGGARDYVELFHWARSQGCSDEVLSWLLGQAAQANPDDPELLEAQRVRGNDLAERAELAARREEIRRRPRYKIPSDDDDPLRGPAPEKLRRGDAQQQLSALQEELERQRERIKELEARQPRRVIRRRPRANLVNQPCVDVEPLPVPAVTMPPARHPPGTPPPNPSGKLPPSSSGRLPPPAAMPPAPPPPLFPPPPPCPQPQPPHRLR